MKREQAIIFLVEDNPSDEMLTTRAIRQIAPDCVLEVARDGHEATERLQDPGLPPPQLILLDLKLPKIRGNEVIGLIRASEKTALVPIICLSSSDEPSDVTGCFKTGANSFVRKPTDFEEYIDKVSKLTDYWLNVNEHS